MKVTSQTGEEPTLPLKFVPDLFSEQATAYPNRMAIDAVDGTMTFSTLEQRTNIMAQHLLAQGVQRDTVVAVIAPRKSILIETLLAIWRASAAFLIIDPHDPYELSRYKVKTAAAALILCTTEFADPWRDENQRLLILNQDLLTPPSPHIPLPNITRNDLAYVVFTSGSTGRPKGVMIEHGGLAEHVATQLTSFYAPVTTANTPLRVGGAAPVSFDSFIDQILPMITLGHTLVLFDEQQRLMPEYFLDSGPAALDVVDCAPSQLTVLVGHGLLKRQKPLRLIVFGGESPAQHTWDQLRKSGIRAISIYGATECSIGSMAANVHEHEWVNLGFADGSARVYLLDEEGNMLPPGIVGEIYLAGPGVGRGYIGSPVETARSFLPDPFSPHPNARMYRTGDMGKMDSSGRLFFCGRRDNQVKIRGFRVELGEVEAALMSVQDIHQAAVIPFPYTGVATNLTAFFVGSTNLEWAQIKEQIAQRLPSHMIPARAVQLDALPLTRNGKIDRRALAKLPVDSAVTASFVPPANDLEAWVCNIWQEVLACEQISVTNDFMSIGGNSLAALEIIARIQDEFHHSFDIRAALAAHTVRQMAAVLAQANHSQEDKLS